MKTFVLRLNKLIEHSAEMIKLEDDYNKWKGKFDGYNVVKRYLDKDNRTKEELVSLLHSLQLESIHIITNEINAAKLEYENGKLHSYSYMLDLAEHLR